MALPNALRRLCIRSLVLLMTASGVALLSNGWLRRKVRGRLHRQGQELPSREMAIVLGAKVYPDGSASPVLEDRLTTALMLYRAGLVKKVLVSGDARAKSGDESEVMRRWLAARGVTPADVVVDPRGVRTLSTMVRAATVFGVRGAVVCTQAFHLPRAVFLAGRSGIDAVGVSADQRIYRKRRSDRAREFFALQVAFLDSYLFRSRLD